MGLTWAGWFPQAAHSDPSPPTVGDEVAVDPTRLIPSGSGSGPDALAMEGAAVLHAALDTRTAATTVCAPFWFTGVALTWDQSTRAPVHADIRASEDGEVFTRAERLGTDPADAPDRDSPEFHADQQGTPLLWTGGARCARFHLELPAGTSLANLKVVFINSSGSSAGPGTAAPSQADGLLWQDAANAMTADPTIITRDQWGAPAKPDCGPYYADAVKMAFVHHTDGLNRYAKSASDDILRGILYYHVRVRHWCDIAYNFLIDKYGRIFEGRAGGIELPVIGAATQGVNTGSTSVSLMGSYQNVHPTNIEIVALKRFLAWRLDVAHVPPNVRTTMTSFGGDNTWLNKGQSVRLHTISGHRDTGYTDCPGNHVYKLLPGIRRTVNRMGLPKISYPAAEPSAPGTPPWKFTAKGSAALDWTVEIADAGGNVIRTLTLAGAEKLKVSWDGQDESAVDAPPGKYTVTISGTKASDKARPATVYARLKAPPSPSPSPSP